MRTHRFIVRPGLWNERTAHDVVEQGDDFIQTRCGARMYWGALRHTTPPSGIVCPECWRVRREQFDALADRASALEALASKLASRTFDRSMSLYLGRPTDVSLNRANADSFEVLGLQADARRLLDDARAISRNDKVA